MTHNALYWWMGLAMLTWAIAWTNAKIVNEYLSFYNLVFFRYGILNLVYLRILENFKISISGVNLNLIL